jgi:hypothetical protein
MSVGPVGDPIGPVRHGFLALLRDPTLYTSGGLFMATGRGVYHWFGSPAVCRMCSWNCRRPIKARSSTTRR